MATNESLIKKADMALADLASNGGLLGPEQTDKFIQTLIDSPTILNRCRVVTMTGATKEVNKIGMGNRVLRAGSSAPLAEAKRVKPTTSVVNLSSKKVIAEVRLPYEVIEDNIEQGRVGGTNQPGGIHDTIVTLLGNQASLDMEDFIINGDTSNATDELLALNDGLLVLAASHQVDAAASAISKTIFKSAVQAMPSKYLRNRAAMGFFLSPFQETEYRSAVADRTTALGDAALTSAAELMVHGSPVIGCALMPNANIIYTNPSNLIFGIQRKVTLEYDRDISAQQFIVVLSARIDFKIEELDAVVNVIDLGD